MDQEPMIQRANPPVKNVDGYVSLSKRDYDSVISGITTAKSAITKLQRLLKHEKIYRWLFLVSFMTNALLLVREMI